MAQTTKEISDLILEQSKLDRLKFIAPSSLDVRRMGWEQAHLESWCTSAVTNHRPNLQMLTDDGEAVIKLIYNVGYNPFLHSRSKANSHNCQITFDRNYVIFWFAQILKELVLADSKLLEHIGMNCEIEQITPITPTKLTEVELREIAKEMGFRMVKAHK